jgi:hypothetical protein
MVTFNMPSVSGPSGRTLHSVVLSANTTVLPASLGGGE